SLHDCGRSPVPCLAWEHHSRKTLAARGMPHSPVLLSLTHLYSAILASSSAKKRSLVCAWLCSCATNSPSGDDLVRSFQVASLYSRNIRCNLPAPAPVNDIVIQIFGVQVAKIKQ